jgi:hypothetical protein
MCAQTICRRRREPPRVSDATRRRCWPQEPDGAVKGSSSAPRFPIVRRHSESPRGRAVRHNRIGALAALVARGSA